MQTLKQFVKVAGSPERAAQKIGVSGMTVRRGLAGKPLSWLVRARLKEMGIHPNKK